MMAAAAPAEVLVINLLLVSFDFFMDLLNNFYLILVKKTCKRRHGKFSSPQRVVIRVDGIVESC